FKGRRIVASEGITPIALRGSHDHGHNHGKPGNGSVDDPHLWHDLTRMQAYTGNIANGMAAADPAHAEGYRARGAAYAAELQALDSWAAAEIGKLPQAQRKVITQHDAVGYLAAHYDIAFMAPQGVTTEAEASAEA